MKQALALRVLGGFAALSAAGSAQAAVIEVPRDHATIQEAVTSAAPGDQIVVAPGEYCGAVIDKTVHLEGVGHPSIIGCSGGPSLSTGVHVGFLLSGSAGSSPASGSSITGFDFDGRGISNTNLAPLGFGILGRFASEIAVVGNRFYGTVQAITNTAGDRWVILHNRIEDLTLFDCTRFCTGGDGIVIQVARPPLAVAGGSAEPLNRPEGNFIAGNRISGAVPDGFDQFGMAGILVFSADKTSILHNEIGIPDNPSADAPGQGVLITNLCCGEVGPLLPGTRQTLVAFNDASRSEDGFVVEGSGGQNTEGLWLSHNRGSVMIEGVEQEPPHHPHCHHFLRPKLRWF